jgi:hypothetical protein
VTCCLSAAQKRVKKKKKTCSVVCIIGFLRCASPCPCPATKGRRRREKAQNDNKRFRSAGLPVLLRVFFFVILLVLRCSPVPAATSPFTLTRLPSFPFLSKNTNKHTLNAIKQREDAWSTQTLCCCCASYLSFVYVQRRQLTVQRSCFLLWRTSFLTYPSFSFCSFHRVGT